jgi:hypothetical protein
MSNEQIAIIVRDALRQAAKECGCKPSEALNPSKHHPASVDARNIAIRLAFDQGISRKLLTSAFRRDEKTIRTALKMTAAD